MLRARLAPFFALVASVASVVVVACGSSQPPLLLLDPPSGGDDGGDLATPAGASSGGSTVDGGGDGDDSDGGLSGLLASIDGGDDGCSAAAKLVYLIDEDATLHAFLPSTLGFATIGTVRCPAAAGAYPNSMAVDRNATAWVNYTSGEIFRVSTADASCQATSFVPNQDGLGVRYGMGFASNSAGSLDETLYIVGSVGDTAKIGRGLAWIDTTTLALTPIGDFSGALAGKGAELTGTGAGALYGFFETEPATLAEIDPSTGATTSPQALPGVSTGDAYAFSFWGGDFWFYTAATGQTSNVTRLAASSDGGITVVATDLGFVIDGAGVSTCAPTTRTPL